MDEHLHNNKVDHRPPAQGILTPSALVDTLLLKHYGQTVTSAEVQEQNTAQVQIREAAPLSLSFPGLTVIAHLCGEGHQSCSY